MFWQLSWRNLLRTNLVTIMEVSSSGKACGRPFAAARLTVLEGYGCPWRQRRDFAARGPVALGGKTRLLSFLDDFHLLGDEPGWHSFNVRLAYRLPERPPYRGQPQPLLPGSRLVRLGRQLHRIKADGLRLNSRGSCWPTPTFAAWRSTAPGREPAASLRGGSPPST